MTGWLRRVFGRVGGVSLPDGFPGRLVAEENVLASAGVRDSGHLVATSLGLWLPDNESSRRVGWHLISKATWDGGSLTVTEAEETGTIEEAVLLVDRSPRRFRLMGPGILPNTVHERVTGSVKSSHHRDLPGGGAWFVQRKVAGRDGIVLQVRADPGTDPDAIRSVVGQVVRQLRAVRRES